MPSDSPYNYKALAAAARTAAAAAAAAPRPLLPSFQEFLGFLWFSYVFPWFSSPPPMSFQKVACPPPPFGILVGFLVFLMLYSSLWFPLATPSSFQRPLEDK